MITLMGKHGDNTIAVTIRRNDSKYCYCSSAYGSFPPNYWRTDVINIHKSENIVS